MGPCSKRCTITKETRNNCARCRFERCIAVGMAVEKIRFGKTPKHVANLIMNAASRTTNFILPTNNLEAHLNYGDVQNYNNNNNKSFCTNNPSLDKLMKSLISYIDSATQDYLSILQQQQQQQHVHVQHNYHQTSYNNSNSHNKAAQFNDYQTSSVYLTPSTSSSSLPQSKSTSPYLHHNLHQQHQQQNLSTAQELLWKLKQKITNKLNEYLAEMNDRTSQAIKGEKENTKIKDKKGNKLQLSSSFDCIFAAYLFLIISDQKQQQQQQTVKPDIDIIEKTILQNPSNTTSPSSLSSSSPLSSTSFNQKNSYFDLDYNLMANKVNNKKLLNNLQSTLDRVYRNNTEDCNRIVKILHFILILLMQNYYSFSSSSSASTTTSTTKTNNDFDFNYYDANGFYSNIDESVVVEDDIYVNNNNLKLQKVIAGLIGLKCHNKLTKRKILLSLENFCEF
jgi:hypothetical protein